MGDDESNPIVAFSFLYASVNAPKHTLLARVVLYTCLARICLFIGNDAPSKAFKNTFTRVAFISNESIPILSNSSKTKIAFSALFISPLHSSIKALNSSSIVVPTIPSGTKLQVLIFLKGTLK